MTIMDLYAIKLNIQIKPEKTQGKIIYVLIW